MLASILRTLIVSAVLASIVLLGFWRISSDQKQRAIDELTALNAELQMQITRREQMIERLSRSRRVAHIDITAQEKNQSGDITSTNLLLIELDDHGRELGRQAFTVPGHVLFIDAWTVKFDHEPVASGHPLMGRSLVLLRRVYSDQVPPRDGQPIDLPGATPTGYTGSEMSRFEQQIWRHFWDIATDPAAARSIGVRIAQGEAVYKPVKAGQQYELIVDAAGGMSMKPLDTSDFAKAK